MPLYENLRAIAYMARHDPLPILGFCLLGASGVLYFHMLLKMSRAGFDVNSFWRASFKHKLPSNYLKIGTERGWSPLPAYLIWPCALLGVVALISGLFLLHD